MAAPVSRIAQIPRAEWLGSYLDIQPGQGLAAFEATQQGKTHILYQCAERFTSAYPEIRAVSLMPKSRSPATRVWAERLGWQIIDRWPPPPRWPGQRRPAGYVLWPPHLTGVPVKVKREALAGTFRRCLADQTTAGDSLTIIDDAHVVAPILGLNPEIEELLTTGGEGGAAGWLAAQKTSGSRATGSLTTFAYNQPEHFLLGYEPIELNRQRFNEIGAVDSGVVSDIVAHLPRHPVMTPRGIKYVSDKLHIDLRGPWMCQVTGL